MDEMTRCFIAVELPHDIHEHIEALQRQHAPQLPSARWTTPHNCHITLRFLGEIRPRGIEAATAAMRAAARSATPFTTTISGLGAFPSPEKASILWAGITDGSDRLAGMAAMIERSLVSAGFAPEKKAFSPHVTIARFREPRRTCLTSSYEDASFTTDSIVLFSSNLRPSGPRYSEIFRVRFGDISP